MPNAKDSFYRTRTLTATTSDIVKTRVATGISTVGVGGSIGAIAIFYMSVPNEIQAHVVALIIFGWQTITWAIGYAWDRKFNR